VALLTAPNLLAPQARAVLAKKSRPLIVVDCLNAALWAVSRTTSFRSAILLAANLGEDADTTAAVAGQLAGALYGASEVPKGWLEKLAWQPRIISTAERLLAAGLPDFHELGTCP
jgi:ADP-ribosylglycohydrolase